MSHKQCDSGIMKVVHGIFVGFVLVHLATIIGAVNVNVEYGDGTHQRLYFRNYNLVCPTVIEIGDSYSDEERLFITFDNVQFVRVGKTEELRQNHKYARRVSFYKLQLTDATGEVIKFNTIQPMYAEYAPYYLGFDCNQSQNRLTIRIRAHIKARPLNLFKQPFIRKHNQRELYARKDHKSKSSNSGSSGKNQTRRGISRRQRSKNNKNKNNQTKPSKIPTAMKKIIIKPIIKKKPK